MTADPPLPAVNPQKLRLQRLPVPLYWLFGTWKDSMIDELERLASCTELYRLLEHYAGLGSADREVWQDRLMTIDGVEPKQLSRLHGELIAFGWAEQNTGHTAAGDGGGVGRCYRVTSAGLRALRQVGREQPANEEQQREPLAAATSEALRTSPTP